MTPFRRLVFVVVALVAVLSIAAAAMAAAQVELGGKLRTGNRVVVGRDEIVPGNLYVVAGSAEIHGTVRGDLVVSGGSVIVDGTIDGDLLALGGNVTVSSDVGGDVIASGGQVSVVGDVAGDVRLGAGEMSVAGDVAGDVAAVGGSTDIAGTVGADLLVLTGDLRIDGTVRGDVAGTAGTYQRGGTVGGDEQISLPDRTEPTPGRRILAGLTRAVAVFLLTLLVVLVGWRPVDAVLDTARTRPGWSLLAGLVVFVGLGGAVAATIILGILVTVAFGVAKLGLVVATYWLTFLVAWTVAGFALFLVANLGAPLVVGLTAARAAGVNLGAVGPRILALAVAVAVYTAVVALPYVGGPFGFLAFLFALGAPPLALRASRGGSAASPDAGPATAA